MESKHTPGPWVISDDWIDQWEKVVCAKCGEGKIKICDAPLNKKDASLVAAAPDLLEALEIWHHNETCINLNAGDHEGQICGDCPWCITKKAIAKAKGDQQ